MQPLCSGRSLWGSMTRLGLRTIPADVDDDGKVTLTYEEPNPVKIPAAELSPADCFEKDLAQFLQTDVAFCSTQTDAPTHVDGDLHPESPEVAEPVIKMMDCMDSPIHSDEPITPPVDYEDEEPYEDAPYDDDFDMENDIDDMPHEGDMEKNQTICSDPSNNSLNPSLLSSSMVRKLDGLEMNQGEPTTSTSGKRKTHEGVLDTASSEMMGNKRTKF